MNNDWRTLEPYDWRYSAAITGLIRYFKYFDEKKDDWKIENECLIYNPASLYAKIEFVLYKFSNSTLSLTKKKSRTP